MENIAKEDILLILLALLVHIQKKVQIHVLNAQLELKVQIIEINV